MGGHGGDDPQSPRRPAVLVLFPGDPGGELRRALVRAPGVSGGRGRRGTGGSGLENPGCDSVRFGASLSLEAWLMQRAALASLLILGMLLTPAHAQRDTTVRLTGTVRSSINGLPVSGVMIAVKGSRVFNVSDATGSFTLVGLPGGRQTVRILYGDSLS